MVIDLYLVFSFIKRLVTPFDKWAAFKEGIIDKKGNIIIRRKDFTTRAQRQAFGIFDQLILNIKKLLAKLPGCSTRLASYAAALWLIKEQNTINNNQMLIESNDDYLVEEFMREAESRFIEEYGDILAEAQREEDTTVGSGAIAGLGVGPQGEPGVSKKAQKKHIKKNFADFILQQEKK